MKQRLGIGLICLIVIYLLLPSKENELVKELKLSNWKELGLNFQPSKKIKLKESSIQQQLATQYPFDNTKPYPNLIWQTWKVDVDHESFPPRYKKYSKSWYEKNTNYKHFVIPDEQCDILIEELYKKIPEVAKAYKIMPKSILKADFFRYLILFARGGVYTDIDTVDLKPIDSWISKSINILDKPNNSGLVVGIEADPDRPDWAEWYARRIQFCQWTIQAKKGHPMLGQLIERITEITLSREKKNQLGKVLGKDQGGDIMNWTGPGIFTDMVFQYMNNNLQSSLKKYESQIDWKIFTGMKQPILIDDILVLPITSFSPDVNQMGAKDSSDPMAYAKHMFSGSWKDDGMPEMD